MMDALGVKSKPELPDLSFSLDARQRKRQLYANNSRRGTIPCAVCSTLLLSPLEDLKEGVTHSRDLTRRKKLYEVGA